MNKQEHQKINYDLNGEVIQHIEFQMKEKTVKIIDLFAGIGGFHLGLSQVEGWQVQCVLASEIDDQLADLYRKNFPDVEVEVISLGLQTRLFNSLRLQVLTSCVRDSHVSHSQRQGLKRVLIARRMAICSRLVF